MIACSASPVALSRVASGSASYQTAYSACSARSSTTASCQRCDRLRRSAGRRYRTIGVPAWRARQRAWVEVANDLSNAQWRLFIAPTQEEQAAAVEALAPILASYEEATATGVIAPDGFSYAHLAIASSVLRFVIAEEQLGVRVLGATPRFDLPVVF